MTIAWDHTTKPSTCRVLDEQGRERLRGTYNQCAEYITETLATKAAGTAVAVWRKRVEELEGALQEAVEHLEYCNWGDKWARECAHHQRLPERLRAALGERQEVAA